MEEKEEKQTKKKIVSIVIETHLYLEDFNRIIEQLKKLEDVMFIIKSKTYTSEGIRDEKVTIASSSDHLYSDMYNLR